MASITKHGFFFVLVGLSFASIASAQVRGLPAVAPGAKAGALSVERGASREAREALSVERSASE